MTSAAVVMKVVCDRSVANLVSWALLILLTVLDLLMFRICTAPLGTIGKM